MKNVKNVENVILDISPIFLSVTKVKCLKSKKGKKRNLTPALGIGFDADSDFFFYKIKESKPK